MESGPQICRRLRRAPKKDFGKLSCGLPPPMVLSFDKNNDIAPSKHLIKTPTLSAPTHELHACYGCWKAAWACVRARVARMGLCVRALLVSPAVPGNRKAACVPKQGNSLNGFSSATPKLGAHIAKWQPLPCRSGLCPINFFAHILNAELLA